MTLGQLPSETRPAWWVREQRVHVTSDGDIIYDPKLWWPMEVIKRAGRAFRSLLYSVSWRRVKLPRVVGGKVRTYKQHARGYPRASSRVWSSTRQGRNAG
jgi:hypothetical protein